MRTHLVLALLTLGLNVPESLRAQVIGTPAPVSPADGASNLPTTITMTWTSASLATSYEVQISTDNAFKSIVFDHSFSGTSCTASGLSQGTNYFWRVRGVGVLVSGNWSSSSRFSTAQGVTGPATPVLASPSNGATNQPTTLVATWNAAAGADHYWIQVATDQFFTSIVVGDSTVAATSRQVDNLAASTTYYWRVRGMNSAGVSSWSNVWDFTTTSAQVQAPSTPTLVSPQNGAMNQETTLTFTWDSSASADHYFLQVATDQNFSSLAYSNYAIIGTSQQVTGLQAGTTYYWQVKAVNAGGQSSWSTIWSFSTGSPAPPPSQPILFAPSNGATNQPDSLLFVWYSSPGAQRYRLQIALNGSFVNKFLDDSALTDTSDLVTGLAGGTTYYWRVQAIGTTGYSPWSGRWSFSTGSPVTVPSAPALLSPPNGSTNMPPTDTLSWTTSSGALFYRVQLSLSASFASLVVDDSSVAQPPRIVGGLSPGKVFYWRVSAGNSKGQSGWSQIWSFTTAVVVQTPAAPLLASPVNGASDQPSTDTLRWSPSQGATLYSIGISTYPSLDSTLVRDSTTTDHLIIVGPLRPLTTYYWHVRASNESGMGAWSSAWSFSTVSADSVPLKPVLASPPDGAGNRPLNDTLAWNPTQGAQSYRVQLSSSVGFDASLALDTAVTGEQVAIGPLAPGGLYRWRVMARNGAGNSSWSSVWQFSTTNGIENGPQLRSPRNGTTNLPVTVVCSWDSVTEAQSYDVQVGSDSSFGLLVQEYPAVTQSFVAVSGLSPDSTYFWRVRARNSAGSWTLFSTSWQFTIGHDQASPSSVTAAFEVDYPGSSNTSHLKPSDYRLVGLPGASSVPLSTIIGGGPGKSWAAYWDNGAPSNYLIQFSPGVNDSTFICSTGRAFWLIKDGPLVVDTTVAATPLDSAGCAEIPLHVGWNLITDPFSDTVAWDAVQVRNALSDPLYAFTGAFGISPELVPGYGYYFFNTQGSSVLLIPRRSDTLVAGTVAGVETRKKPAEWNLRIVTTAGGVQDDATRIGVSSAVTSEWNRYDVRKPVGMKSVPATYFSHPEWDRDYSTFGSEIHPATTAKQEWHLDVEAAPFQGVALRFDGIDHVPQELCVYARDPYTRVWENLRTCKVVRFIPATQKTLIDILVGSEDAIRGEVADQQSAGAGVGPNYPNPFNLSTIIPVSVQSRTHVNVTIFNIIGQRIAEVFDGDVGPGPHQFVWNGTDAAGIVLASGIYFSRTTIGHGAPGFVHKMLLLK